ncbi:20450_t:CDS:2 [Dentiscutata erythropus]|uniref:Dynactin subunit 4 n=1 Tax=Dentiscutata erythropus TaxID=1348616 RepID=A0A9N9EQZ2_9GLOM|nr:20450_t:CDS:2 [Dentiscutata erythropus]
MSQQIDARQRSYVHYYCPCPDVSISNNTEEEEEEDIVESIPEFDVNSPRVQFSTFSMSKLYFCDDCHQIRCPRCVQEEIVCYYCPNCLFEVPTASCPICQNTLSVVASTEPPPPQTSAPSNSSASTTSGAPYYLSCGVCRWDSQEIGMTFEKATGLALQLQKTEDERPDVKEFDHLKDHFEKHLRLSAPSTTLPSSLLSIPGISGFSNRYGGSGFTHPQQKSDDVAKYDAIVKVESDDSLVHDLVQLKDVNQITTLTQRMNQLSDQPYKVERLQPQRIHLRTKRVKRCRSCRHILIKPEQKAQATRFKIKLVAFLPKLILNQCTRIVLKFANPLYEEIIVDLALKDETTEYAKITLLAPHFNITPYNEVWEYDEQDLISSKGRPLSITSAPKVDSGIYERRGNYTSVLVEITPLAEVDELKVCKIYYNLYFFITKFKVNDNDNNETSGDAPVNDSSTAAETASSDKPDADADKPNTDTDKPSTDADKSNTDADKSKSDDNKGDSTSSTPNTKSLFFWTVIGLGPVVSQVAAKPPASTRPSLTSNNSNVTPTRTNVK